MTVRLLPEVGLNPEENLVTAIAFYTKYSPFSKKHSWNWSDISWDVKGICKAPARKATQRHYIHFNRDNNKGKSVKTLSSDMEAFHTPSLSDVAKCHITASQIEKAKDFGVHQILINAYRFLDNVMSKTGMEVKDLTVHQFKLAEQNARASLKDTTYYRAAQKLELISLFMYKMQFTYQRTKYKKTAKRSDNHSNSDSRIDTESVTIRNKKLPSKQSLIALATLSNTEMNQDDEIFQSMAEIMFATGLRFDELITLEVDCLKEKEVEEVNVLTGYTQTFKVHELTYKARKGGGYRTKDIAELLVPILKKGLNTAKNGLQPVRDTIVKCLQGEHDFFPSLTEGNDLFVTDVWEMCGFPSRSVMSSYLKRRDIKLNKVRHPESGMLAFTFSQIELKNKTLNFARVSARNLWSQIKDLTASPSLQNMLFITQNLRHHSEKRTEYWSFTTFTHLQLSDYIAGRPSMGVKSVFERYNLMFEGKPIRLTSHQFRHFLNTILDLADSVSELEVARYFGRKHMGDNEAYDHTNKAKKVMDAAEDIISSHGISEEQAKEASILFTLVDKEEALETVADLTTTLVTSIGMCSHDYNDSPCGKHYACLRGCSEYHRTKGDKSEIAELERIKAQQEKHIIAAKEAVDEEFHGSNNWLLSHTELYEGCLKALEIENNAEIETGDKVQIFPDGENGCKPIWQRKK